MYLLLMTIKLFLCFYSLLFLDMFLLYPFYNLMIFIYNPKEQKLSPTKQYRWSGHKFCIGRRWIMFPYYGVSIIHLFCCTFSRCYETPHLVLIHPTMLCYTNIYESVPKHCGKGVYHNTPFFTVCSYNRQGKCSGRMFFKTVVPS